MLLFTMHQEKPINGNGESSSVEDSKIITVPRDQSTEQSIISTPASPILVLSSLCTSVKVIRSFTKNRNTQTKEY